MNRSRYWLALRFAWVLWAAIARPQGVITTVAGGAFTFPSEPLPALRAPIGSIGGVAVDTNGNVYLSDYDNSLVMKVDPRGTLTVVAGNGAFGFSGDSGAATSAALNVPVGIALDANGNLYVADRNNHCIRKVTPAGIITTVAGTGKAGFSGDGGPAVKATLSSPYGVAVDATGNLFITDTSNYRIRKVTVEGTITTAAGNGAFGFSGDGGPAVQASLFRPLGIAIDGAGNVFVSDNSRIRRITSAGAISTVAGNGTIAFTGDGGAAINASFGELAFVAVDAAGNLFIADWRYNRIRRVTPGGIITTVAGDGGRRFSGDGGPAIQASFFSPYGVAADRNGNLFVADTGNGRVRQITAGNISTIAGNGQFRFSGDGGDAASASLYSPRALAVDARDDILVVDTLNNRIRKFTPGGKITTVAGNGAYGFSGDGGPATNASLDLGPLDQAGSKGAAVDVAGNVFFSDEGNVRIRKVAPSGIITSLPGIIQFAEGLTTDSTGSLYVAGSGDSYVYKVAPNGVMTTVGGTGASGFSGDGGPAAKAALANPNGVSFDAAGNLLIADTLNSRVRKITPGGTISTIAGTGAEGRGAGFSGDGGPAIAAALNLPRGVTADAFGNIYIADTGNHRIRKVTPDGIIHTVAGNGTQSFSGDGGLATAAAISNPNAVAVDRAGNLYIADSGNNRIREVLAAKPQLQVSTSALSFAAQSSGALPPAQSFSVTAAVSALEFSVAVNPGDSRWLSVTPQAGLLPRLIDLTADPSGLAPGIYQASVTITVPNASPTSATVVVSFVVTPGAGPQLEIDNQSLSFSFASSSTARNHTLIVSNAGGGQLNFTATATTGDRGNWLSVSPASGQATPPSPAPLNVIADPAGLAAGTYTGAVILETADTVTRVPVTMTISTLSQAILLSQRGLSFTVVANGGVVPPQTFEVLNIGSGAVRWTAVKSTLSGGDWLQITPASGTALAGAPSASAAIVNVNAGPLGPGSYYGLVEVDAPPAANSPQVLTVFLQVLPAGSDVGAMAQPGGLLFAAPAGGEAPGSQDILLYNITAGPKSFRAVVAADPGLSIVMLPTSATLDPQQPTRIVVQPFTSGLAAGVYSATVTFQFDDGRVRRVNLKIVVTNGIAAGSDSAALKTKARSAGVSDGFCTPTKLVTTLTTLADAFAVSAGWPVALGASVRDNCGTPLQAGSVTVSFSNGDAPVVLQSLQDGRWSGTWPTRTATPAKVTLKLHAENPQVQISGDQQISGDLQAQQQPPKFDVAGIVSAAGGPSYTAVAPGSLISVYGDRLAENAAQAPGLPLPPQLANTQVFMAGLKLRLYYVNQTQVNAQIPYGVPVNTPLQLLVQRGLTYSLPALVNVAPAEPAIFNGGPPLSAGFINAFPSDGSAPYLVTPATPARAGYTITLFCSGLGAVNPAVPDGSAPGAQTSITANAVQLLIGNQTAQVTFAGLAPGYAGLYQVNAIVPQGAGRGDAVPVVLSIAGQNSPQITMAIQ